MKLIVSDCSSCLTRLCCVVMQVVYHSVGGVAQREKCLVLHLWSAWADAFGHNATSNCMLNYIISKAYRPKKKKGGEILFILTVQLISFHHVHLAGGTCTISCIRLKLTKFKSCFPDKVEHLFRCFLLFHCYPLYGLTHCRI